MAYQIITDATSDLPAKVAAQSGVEVIPMSLELDGKTVVYVPGGGDVTPEDFYATLRAKKRAHTSQINPQVYEQSFERSLREGKDVIYICFSSGISATLQAARLAAQELEDKYPGRAVRCVDSLCASVGEGFLVLAAAEAREAGLSFQALCDWLEEYRGKVVHWFTVDDLDTLHRGGRVSAAAAVMGGALQIKPVLHVDDGGYLVPVEKVRGRRRSLMAMAERMDATWRPEAGRRVLIGHGDAPEDAAVLAARVKEAHPEAEISLWPIGPVIGAHTGPGVVALFFWGTAR